MRSEFCEPCGTCDWCARRHKYKADRALLVRALERAVVALREEQHASDGDDHPVIIRHRRIMDSAEKVLARVKVRRAS